MKHTKFYACFVIILCIANITFAQESARWQLASQGGIVWNTNSQLPHNDHIEMSGLQLSVVLRYGVNSRQAFELNRSIVWPMLRFWPNDTHAHLNRRFAINVNDLVQVNNSLLGAEQVSRITLNGLMEVESHFPANHLHLVRSLYPSPTQPAYIEKYVFKNTGDKMLTLDLPALSLLYVTDSAAGVYGEYIYEVNSLHQGHYLLAPNQEAVYYVAFSARKAGETAYNANPEHELAARKGLVNELWSNLVLQTPDSVLNRMFAFAKLRGAESIYKTKGGLMHGPGGEAYYAAIWANDEAEYIGPLFPFLGYGIGNRSALNAYLHFARFMNPDYRPIPSSIIAEGDGYWNGAKDRGDAAMIAYGAGRYALAQGDKAIAEELWPLIEWCLEYCRRQLNEQGVVKSDSDELEGRFLAGKANLCTSALYYDALLSAACLGKELGKPVKQYSAYKQAAGVLRKDIENYFGYKVEGFETYRYYEGNDVLRSWICIPLTVGIFDRSKGTVSALFSPRLWTNDGLLTQAGTETFWDRTTLYALRGVFAAGATEKGLDYLKRYSQRRLLGEHVPYAIEAWPEGSQRHLSAESGLYCRIYTEGLFGIRPTGLRSFELCPQLPAGWEYMNLEKIHAFGQVFTINISRYKQKLQVLISNGNTVVLKKQINPGEKLTVVF